MFSSQKLRQSIYSGNDKTLIDDWEKLIELKKENMKENEELILQLEKSIVNKSHTYIDKQQSFNIDCEQIRESLDIGEGAIELFALNLPIEGEDADELIYYGLLLRKEFNYPLFIELGVEDEISGYIYNSDYDSLSNIIWESLKPFFEGLETIYIAPSGILHNVSFAGLKKEGRYLCEDYTIHNLLSTKDIIKLKDQKEDSSKSRQIALFGGADFLLPNHELSLLDRDSEDSGDNYLTRSMLNEMDPLRGPGFMYLPGTKREVESINQHLTALNWKTSLFTDKAATETRFKSLSSAESPDVIHISTHGFYFPQPKIDFSDKDGVDLLSGNQEQNIYRLSDNPLMRSGLAFTGANHVWKGNDPVKGTDDGILTAYEISNLNLFNTELVVLSACNTGLGDIDHGEGVYGLQRAFRMAGVQTMIVSLWEVPDKETVELMTAFYTFWGEGMTKKEAFDKAQMKMRYIYPDQPEKWSGFIMIE